LSSKYNSFETARLRDTLLVRRGVHQRARDVGNLDLHQPPTFKRRFVDRAWRIVQRFVDFDDGPRHRRVHVRRRLYGFDDAERLGRFHFRPNFREFHVHDVTQFCLRVVRDANRGDVAVNLRPVVCDYFLRRSGEFFFVGLFFWTFLPLFYERSD